MPINGGENQGSSIPTLEGREFRQVWEEHLTSNARRVVRRAVRKGKVLGDPGLASIAVSLARQRQRLSALEISSLAGTLLIWIFISRFLYTLPEPNLVVTVWKFLATLTVLAVPGKLAFWFWVERPHYRRSEMKNLRQLRKLNDLAG